MKLLLHGNCQVEATAKALRLLNPKIKIEYSGSSNGVRNFDPERAERLMDWCDHLIAQPIMNRRHPEYHENMRERFGDRVTFVPYVVVKGFFSLVRIANQDVNLGGIAGSEVLVPHLEKLSLKELLEKFNDGDLYFDNKERFEQSLIELKRRERFSDIKISRYIEENVLKRQILRGPVHPKPVVFNPILRQIGERLGLHHDRIPRGASPLREAVTLPRNRTLHDPRAMEALGSEIPFDPAWRENGRRLIVTVARAYREQKAKQRGERVAATMARRLPEEAKLAGQG